MSKITNVINVDVFLLFWIGHTMGFQDMYNTFCYVFTIWSWKAKNRGHFAVFVEKTHFYLVKKNEKNSEFAVGEIWGARFDLFLTSTIQCTKPSQFFNGPWWCKKCSSRLVIKK